MIWHLLALFSAILVGFIVRDSYACLPYVQRLILQFAVAQLPAERRSLYYEEWLAEVEGLPTAELFRTIRAAGFFVAAGRIGREMSGELSLLAQFWERVFAFFVAGSAVVLLFPLLIATAIAVKLDTSGPSFQRIRTVGRQGRVFERYRFRTLSACTHNSGPELTRVGYWLRMFSIDRSAALINVIKGDMGLIGPMPCTEYSWNAMSDEDRDRYRRDKPGLITPSMLFRHDLARYYHIDFEYMRSRSFRRDIVLLGLVLLVVFDLRSMTEERLLRLILG